MREGKGKGGRGGVEMGKGREEGNGTGENGMGEEAS